jgi:long-subunit fatty acid transport protein
MNKILKFFLIINILFLVFAKLSYSYPNNYQQVLVGSRIAGMGGAGTALGGEGEAGYYNPAGIIYTKKDGISLSVSHYGLAFLSEKGRKNIGDIINTEIQHSSGLIVIPSATTYTLILDKNKKEPQFFLNIGLFVPSSSDLEGHEIGEDANYSHYIKSWQVNYIYHLYVNFAYRVNRFFSFGIALIGSYSKLYQNVSIYRYDKGTPSNSDFLTESYNYKTVGLGFSVGTLFTLDRFRFAFTFKSKKLRIYSESSYTKIIPGSEPVQYEDLKVNYQRPWEFYFGIAYEILKDKIIIAFDFKYYPSENQSVISTSTFSLNLERLSTWNISVGVEYKFNKEWSIRTGFFTDRSATSLLSETDDQNLRMIRVDRYGITLGGGYVSENTKLNLCISYVWGFGKIKIQNVSTPGTYGIADSTTNEVFITIGSAYWFDSNKEKKKSKNGK